MTKFEQIGINAQISAISREEANHRFSISCTLCSRRGIGIKCDRCAIAVAHEQSLSTFDILDEVHKDHPEVIG